MPPGNGNPRKNGKANKAEQQRAQKKENFLEAFSRGRNAAAACKAAGVGVSTVYQWRDDDPDFAEAWDEIDLRIDAEIDATLINRALYGWEEPIVYKGELKGTVTRIDNRLLEFVAARRKPGKWLDRVVAAKAMDLSPEEEDRILEREPRWL